MRKSGDLVQTVGILLCWWGAHNWVLWPFGGGESGGRCGRATGTELGGRYGGGRSTGLCMGRSSGGRDDGGGLRRR